MTGTTKAARGVARLRSLPVRIVGRPTHEVAHTACLAAETALYFMTNGDVRTCCMNPTHPLGNVTRERLGDIWAGSPRQTLVDHLRDDDYSLGCQGCDWQSRNEGEDSSYARSFDVLSEDLARQDPADTWPLHLEFNLSNSCNLQCIQCEGALSSSIRIHREKLPALPRVYDDQFFTDVVPFLAHAKEVQVAGGEPFLGPESMRLFELIAEHAPHATCSVVTNGTQWNKRVEAVLDAIPLTIAISIDGISKDVYESVRVGADHEQVLINIDRFVAYAERVRTSVSFNFCLMVQNYTDFGDLLLYAEERDIAVTVSVVYHPLDCSLLELDAEALGRVCDELEAQSATIVPQLQLNADIWTRELARLRQWHRFRVVNPPSPPVIEVAPAPPPPTTYILGFEQRGGGATDDLAARARLTADAPDQPIHALTLVAGDRIASASPGAADALGLSDDDLLDRDVDALPQLLEAKFGPTADADVLDQGPDHLDQIVTYGTTPFRAIAVALRDDEGWADEVHLLFVAPPSPVAASGSG